MSGLVEVLLGVLLGVATAPHVGTQQADPQVLWDLHQGQRHPPSPWRKEVFKGGLSV